MLKKFIFKDFCSQLTEPWDRFRNYHYFSTEIHEMQRLKKYESILFFLVLLIHLFPVIWFTPFVTLDGPVHLYNARLVHDLMMGADTITNRFFEFNPIIEPNLSGHFLLAMFMFVLPPLIAEKVLLLLIVIAFSLGFRKLILTIEPAANWISWLFFPLIFNFTFLIGFFNFMIGLVVLPFFLSWWIKNQPLPKSGVMYFSGIVFLLLIYYSHILIFLLAGILSAVFLFFNKDQGPKWQNWKLLVIAGTPGFILTLLYLTTHGSQGYHREIQWLPLSKILEDLSNARCIIMYDYTSEKRFTRLFTVLLVAAFVIALKFRSIQKYQQITILWLVIALLMVFVIPDSFASGGIITPRLELWFSISFIIMLATFRIPHSYACITGIMATFFSLFMIFYHWEMQQGLNTSAKEIVNAFEQVDQPAVLLPVNYSNNWMEANLSAYPGAVKKIVVLDNYEADYRLFPIVWKEGMRPSLHAGNHAETQNPCLTISNSEKVTGQKVEYISFWSGLPEGRDSCSSAIQRQLHLLYSDNPIQSGRYTLFKRR